MSANIIPSASVLLVRNGASGLEVLMMQRARHLSFAAGALVFPGGKVDLEDSDTLFWGRRVHGSVLMPDFPYRMAAIRELVEETGILLGADKRRRPVHGTVARRIIRKYSGPARQARRALDMNRIMLSPSSLVPFAHWITPEGMPRRFDTHFYVAAMPAKQQMSFIEGEATRLLWCRPKDILASVDKENVPMMFPTRMNLMKLARTDTVRDALVDAASYPAVRIEPDMNDRANPLHIETLRQAGYPDVDMAKMVRLLPKSEKIAKGTS